MDSGVTEGWLAELRCTQVVHRYATAVDTILDLDLLRTCLAEDVDATYAGRGEVHGVDAVVEVIAALGAMRATIHDLGPVHATVEGDHAHVRAGCIVMAITGGPEARGVLRGVRYTFELARREDDWRITRLVHDVLWATAAPESGMTGEPLTR